MTGRTKLPNPRRSGEPITLDWIKSNCEIGVRAIPMTECWTWLGATVGARDGDNRYGNLNFYGKTMRAHRVAYALAFEDIPDSMVADHVCRNPRCVNPAHISVVSQRENVLRGDVPVRMRGECGVCGGTEFRGTVRRNRPSPLLRCVDCCRRQGRMRKAKVRAKAKGAALA